MVWLQTFDWISTMQSFKSYSCTWCYCKPYWIVSPPCKVLNPTHVHGVTANLTRLYLHHAKFQILLMYMVLLQTLLDCISTMQSFKSYSCVWCYCKPFTRLYLHHAKFQILLKNMALLQTLDWVSNPTQLDGVSFTANLTRLYLHHLHAPPYIVSNPILMYMVLLQTLDWIYTIQSFKPSYSCVWWTNCKPY